MLPPVAPGCQWTDAEHYGGTKSPNVCEIRQIEDGCGDWWRGLWPRQQESNLHLALRRGPFYPLNYGEGGAGILAGGAGRLTRRARQPFLSATLAQVSFSVTVRLNTGRPGWWSLRSAQK